MTYLVLFHWGWIAGAIVIGFGMGWIAQAQRAATGSGRRAALVWLVILAATGLSVAEIVPGRAGYALDLAVALVLAYLAGCLAGSRLRRAIAPVPSAEDRA